MEKLAPAISNSGTLMNFSVASLNPFFIQQNAAEMLFKSLAKKSNLNELDLSGSELRYRGIYALCNYLETDIFLEKLILYNTKLKLNNSSKEELFKETPFIKALKMNKTLKFLNMAFNLEDDRNRSEDLVEVNGMLVGLNSFSRRNYFAPANFLNPTLEYNADDLKKALIGVIENKRSENIDFKIEGINLE